LQLHGVRWYNPGSQRWLTQDPLGLGPDTNPYRYCGNGPTDGSDPTGLAEVKPIEGAIFIGGKSVFVVPSKNSNGVNITALLVISRASDIGGPSPTHHNLGELVKQVKQAIQQYKRAHPGGPCPQLAVLEIEGHSNPFQMDLGPDKGATAKTGISFPSSSVMTAENAGNVGRELLNKLLWSDPHAIILSGCNTGLATDKDKSFPRELASSSRSTVLAAGGYDRGSFYNGNARTSQYDYPSWKDWTKYWVTLFGNGGGSCLGAQYQAPPPPSPPQKEAIPARSENDASADDTWYVFPSDGGTPGKLSGSPETEDAQ